MTTNEPQGTPEEAPAVIAEAFPAGGFLAEELEARGLSHAEFAEMIGRPVRFVAEIIDGTQDITAEAAEQIGAALDTGPQLWINLQDAYRQWKIS
jgi:HTH-type transcriptional regulator/antitoxin HigA